MKLDHIILAAACSVAGIPATAATYTVTDLGTLGGSGPLYSDYGAAFGINDAGQIVGEALSANSFSHAFLYDGTMHDLDQPASHLSRSLGINEAGQVVGGRTVASGDYHAFFYSGGGIADLGTLGGSYSEAADINDSGHIVGVAKGPGLYFRAFLYDGTMHDLGTLGGSGGSASGINNAGQIVGTSGTADNLTSHAFLYDGAMHDIGTLDGNAGSSSIAKDINDAGQVVGDSDAVGGSRHAFLYSGGALSDLGTLGGSKSYAVGISDTGQVMGYSLVAGDMAFHAFLYGEGVMRDLNDLIDPALGWVLTGAYSMNASGQIVGIGVYDGRSRAILLTPEQIASPVPEPATWALMLLGFGAAGQAMRRRALSPAAIAI
jgi:probable HAF family extracellular repeat protein